LINAIDADDTRARLKEGKDQLADGNPPSFRYPRQNYDGTRSMLGAAGPAHYFVADANGIGEDAVLRELIGYCDAVPWRDAVF
jgi:hypothetical protein